MRACTSTYKPLLPLLLFIFSVNSFAQSGVGNAGLAGNQQEPTAAVPNPKKADEPGLYDQSTPYLEYGDFNMNDEDDADTLYFQYGRFFGVSLGLGYQAATGNRGLLYTPAFPRFDIKVQYWFDFQLAMTVGMFFATHTFEINSTIKNVKLMGYGVEFKYYFDVRNAAAAISFANPHLIAGAGAINKTESAATSTAADLDSTFSVNFGVGLEFPIVHKKTYFILDTKYHTQNFLDITENQKYEPKGLSDLSGGFFTLMGHIMFTW